MCLGLTIPDRPRVIMGWRKSRGEGGGEEGGEGCGDVVGDG